MMKKQLFISFLLLVLMLYSGTCTINAVYYEESATP
jgi:hypothetical protein